MMSRCFLWMFALAFLWASVGSARTWRILEDAPTIQAGIDSSTAGDTVLVGPGIYNENLDFKGKPIAVVGSGPQHTILDGSGGNWSCVQFISGEPRSAVLTGFTITGGIGTESGPGEAPAGGGIYIRESEPTVIENVIEGNTTSGWGGGIYCENNTWNTNFSPLIQHNVIRNNTAYGNGGGIGARNSVSPVILDNEIVGNEVQEGDGGGVWLSLTEDGTIVSRNSIRNNVANDHGGGIYGALVTNLRGPVEIEVSWNLLDSNLANGQAEVSNSGGGIWLYETNTWVHHNTIARNTGNGPNDAYAGGIALEKTGSPLVEQNVIAFNLRGGGIWCGGGATPVIRNNLAWQNVGGDGVEDCVTWWQSNGNVIDNPYFCDMVAGDLPWHLTPES